MSLPAAIPAGVWPPRLSAELSAGYCGERSVESFLRGVRAGTYPQPCLRKGKRGIWAKATLDEAIKPQGDSADTATPADVLADLLP